MSQELEKTNSELPQNIQSKTLVLVGLYIAYFVSYSKDSKIACTTKTLLDNFPRLIVEAYGLLSDVLVKESGLFTYKQIGEILDYLVSRGEFTYSADDNKEDFNRPCSLAADIREAMKKYPDYLEEKFKKRNENISNPYK